MISAFFSQVASRAQRYSHCGILDYDSLSGEWVVWHALQDRTLLADGIFCQSLETFVEESEAIAVYPATLLDSSALARMRLYIRDRVATGRYPKLFDSRFDLTDTTTIYCTEFVALAYQATGIALYQVTPTGHTIGIPYAYYTLDDLTEAVTMGSPG